MAFDPVGWARGQRAPFTVALVVSLVVAALVGVAMPGIMGLLALVAPTSQPWGFLTYPWAYSPLTTPLGLVFLILFVFWLLQFGATMERDLGTPRFVLFWLAFTLLPAIIALLLRVPLAGPWLPSSAVVVAWCARNRGATVGFWGIPVSTAILAGIVTVFAVLPYGAQDPLAGIVLVLPLGLAWLFGADRLPLAFAGTGSRKPKLTTVRGGQAYDDAYFENVKQREIEREERERLRRLFEEK